MLFLYLYENLSNLLLAIVLFIQPNDFDTRDRDIWDNLKKCHSNITMNYFQATTNKKRLYLFIYFLMKTRC